MWLQISYFKGTLFHFYLASFSNVSLRWEFHRACVEEEKKKAWTNIICFEALKIFWDDLEKNNTLDVFMNPKGNLLITYNL